MRLSSFRVAGAAMLLAVSACSRGGSVAPTPAPAPIRTTYASGDALIAAMHARYDGKWYRTLTFTQKTSRLAADGKWNVQTWYEAMRIPGKLRIDFDPIADGNGVIYARDSAFSFSKGRGLPGQKQINPLLLLGFDVYGNAPARTAALLRQEGFDLSRVKVDTFENRTMIVVGARKQFWIDAEHLYFVRTLEPMPRDASKTQDVRFVNYERRGTAWIAPRVEIYNDGKLVFQEDYRDVKTDIPLDDAIFDPAKYKTAKHWLAP